MKKVFLFVFCLAVALIFVSQNTLAAVSSATCQVVNNNITVGTATTLKAKVTGTYSSLKWYDITDIKFLDSGKAPTNATYLGAGISISTTFDEPGIKNILLCPSWSQYTCYPSVRCEVVVKPTTPASVQCGGQGSRCVFVTSKTYVASRNVAGELINGLAGADIICNKLASASGVPGTFKAFLSAKNINVKSRLENATVPLKLIDGTVVANNWGEMTTKPLLHAINLDEKGTEVKAGWVWTGSMPNGLATPYGYGNNYCGEWLGSVSCCSSAGWSGSTNNDPRGYDPVTNESIMPRSWGGEMYGRKNCRQAYRLYCFQQGTTTTTPEIEINPEIINTTTITTTVATTTATTTKKVVCPDLYKPVCGVNGKTYSNSCYAYAAGVKVKSTGACKAATTGIGTSILNMLGISKKTSTSTLPVTTQPAPSIPTPVTPKINTSGSGTGITGGGTNSGSGSSLTDCKSLGGVCTAIAGGCINGYAIVPKGVCSGSLVCCRETASNLDMNGNVYNPYAEDFTAIYDGYYSSSVSNEGCNRSIPGKDTIKYNGKTLVCRYKCHFASMLTAQSSMSSSDAESYAKYSKCYLTWVEAGSAQDSDSCSSDNFDKMCIDEALLMIGTVNTEQEKLQKEKDQQAKQAATKGSCGTLCQGTSLWTCYDGKWTKKPCVSPNYCNDKNQCVAPSGPSGGKYFYNYLPSPIKMTLGPLQWLTASLVEIFR